MKTKNVLTLAAATALAFSSASAFAVATIGAGTNSGAAGTNVTIPVTYTRPAGDAFNVFSATWRHAHTNPPITFVSFAPAPGTSPTASSVVCNANMANTLTTCVLTTNPPTAIAVGNYTLGTITYAIGAGATPGPQNLATTVVECTDQFGDAIPGSCNAANGTITVTGGGGNVGPNLAYAPGAGASAGTGGPVVFTGVTTVGSTGNGTIAVTPSGGTGAGTTTTLGNFTLTGADAGNFTRTSPATLTFQVGTNTPQNVTLTCTSGAAQRTANLQATETITGGATSQRFWVLNCPAGSAAGTPPTMTYAPASGSSTNVPAGNSLTIVAGCPNDGAACGGSGSGLAATTRLNTLVATYTGLASPSPTMACSFVNQAGVNVGAPLDFVATVQDPGNIRCTCPANSTGLPTEPFSVSVQESSPASGGVTATRTFNIVCQGAPPPACGTISANPATGTINLSNGGAATQVSSVSLAGAGQGVSHAVNCSVSGASAGSTFNVTTAPSPLTLNNVTTTGTISATCTNSAETTGTATLTCTSTATGAAGCASLAASYTLSCPGITVQPPPSLIPVPALNEQGRVLLAALVLLIGLGVVGFRMRG